MSAEKTVKTVGKPQNTQKATEPVAEPAHVPKKPLSWKEKLAFLPEEEAKAIRAKAAEASRRSKAKKRGTNPEKATVDRLEARLGRIDAQIADLKEARKALAATEKADPTIGMAEVGDTEGYPTEEEYTDGAV